MRPTLRSLFFILLSTLVPIVLIGQNTDKYTTQDFVYEKEFTAGIKLLSNGYGVELNFKKTPNIRYKTVKQFEFVELKDPSEFRQTSLASFGARSTPRSYIFGKQNNFYALNFSYGQDRIITRKGRKNGVSLYWSWKGGPSLGLLKPYYLSLREGDGSFSNERYSEENRASFLDFNQIAGASGFSYGLGEIKIKPGIQARVSTGADWASKRDYIKSAEVGFVLNVYASDIDIMLERDNSFWFANLYVGVLFGRKR